MVTIVTDPPLTPHGEATRFDALILTHGALSLSLSAHSGGYTGSVAYVMSVWVSGCLRWRGAARTTVFAWVIVLTVSFASDCAGRLRCCPRILASHVDRVRCVDLVDLVDWTKITS